MAGRRAGAGLALAAVALSAAGCGSTKTLTTTVTSTLTRTVTTTRTVTEPSDSASDCTAGQLLGTFTLVPGSGAAGQISYTLTLTNGSGTACSVSGVPNVVLLDSNGAQLPTDVPGNGLGVGPITVEPGSSVVATARFSPGVPGPGDSQSGRCQPKAFNLKVTLDGGGSLKAPIQPPTSVCEQGTLNFGPYGG